MYCAAKTKLGQPCRSHTVNGSKFCFFHDAASGRERRAAQTKGGRNRSRLELVAPLPSDFDLRDPESSAALLNFVVNRLVRAQMDPKLAYAIGYIVGLSKQVNEALDYERSRHPHPDGIQSSAEHEIDLPGLPDEHPRAELLASYTDGELLDLMSATSDRTAGQEIGADPVDIEVPDSPEAAAS